MKHLLTPALLLLSLLSAHAAIEITPLVECLCESGGAPQQAFQLTAEGTAGPFTFRWSREGGEYIPSDEQNPTDISLPGKYIVEVTNAYGCTFPYEIEIPACPTPTISGTITETCAGQPTGSITVEVTGGASPYTYIWSNGSGDTPVITGLAEGYYYLTVQDSRGCRETRTYKVLAGSLGFTVNATATPPSCFSSADGAIQLSMQPAGAYIVAWSTGVAGASLSGLAAGTYTATVTDAGGCPVEETVVLPAPPPLTVFPEVLTPATCPESTDGGAALSADGGTPPYSFRWSTGATGGDIDGLAAGAYSATATDANGCTAITTVNILAGNGLAVDAVVIPTSCAGGPDGSLTVSVSGASGQLSYSWSGPEGAINENSPYLNGLDAGEYRVTVTDESGCEVSGQWEVGVEEEEWPYLEEVTIRASNSSSNTGSIIYSGRWVETVSGCLFFQGGNTANFTYQVLQEMGQGLIELEVFARPNRELSSFSLSVAGNDFFPLPPANAVGMFTIEPLTVQAMIVNNTIDQALNFQGTDMDGRPLLDLLSNNPNLSNCVYPPRLQPHCSWSPAPAITHAPNGTDGMDRVHLLKIECISYEYNLYPELSSIEITEISGGTGPFVIHWENLNPEAAVINNGWTVKNLESGGEYCLRILDEGTECTVSDCIKLCKPIEALYDIEIIEPCGYGPAVLNDGSICVRPNAENLIVDWGGGHQNQYCLENLGPGGYTFKINDLECGQLKKVTVNLEYALLSSVNLAEATAACPGADNGSLCVEVTGGRPPYTFEWENGGQEKCAWGLSFGECHRVTVTDACGQTAAACFELPEYAGLQIEQAWVSAACDGSYSGSASVTFSGGKAPYVFVWENLSTGETMTTTAPSADHLGGGAYNLEIFDACGNMANYSFEIIEISPPYYVEIAEVTPSCPGAANGSVSISVTPPYQLNYNWSNGGTGPNISGLEPGTYSVTVSSSDGCQIVRTTSVQEITINITEPSIRNACLGQKTGVIELNVTGIGGPFDYSWSHGEESDVVTGLGPGEYCVTVSSGGCDETVCYTITEAFIPPEIVLSSLDNPTITDGSGSTADGAIAINVIAQTEEYFILWNYEPGSEEISGLSDGFYTAFVTDENGCFDSETYELKYCIQGEVLHFPQRIADFQLSVTDVIPLSEPQSGDGGIVINITPQIIAPNVTDPGVFYYSWTGPGGFISDQQNISGLAEGKYCLTATNGCYTHSLCQLVAYCGDVELEASIVQSAHDPYCFYPGGPDITLSPVVSNPNGEVSYFWEEQHNHILSGEAPRVSYTRWREATPEGLGYDPYVELTIRDEAWCESSDGFPIRSETGEDWDWNYFDLSRAEEVIAYNYFQSYVTAHPNYAFQTVNPFIGACKGVAYCNGQEIDFSQNTTLGCLNGVSEIKCASNIAGMLVKCPLGPTGNELYENVELVTLIDVEIPVGNQGKCKKIRYVLFAGEGGNPFVFSQELDGVFECDPNTDFDNDGDVGEEDGCPAVFNPGQYDCDQDGIPDACDPEPHEDYRLVPLAETCQLEIYCESGGQPIGLVDAPTYDFISVNNSEEECEKQFFCSLNNEFLYSIPGTEYCKTTISDGCIVKTYCSFLDDESPGISPEAVLATDTHYGVDCADIQEVTEHCAQAVFRPSSHQTNEDDPIAGFMKIIPNPNRGKFHIEVWEEKETTVNVEIVSITGAVLWRGGWNLVDGVNKKEFGQEMGLKFPAGIYSVAIHGANGEARYNRFVISN